MIHSTPDLDDVEVAVDATPTELDSVDMTEGRTGVTWQVKNPDGAQTLDCYPEVRLSPTADWVTPEFGVDQLVSIGPGQSKQVLWRWPVNEVRLMGVASGVGLDARLWRHSVYGVQPT